MQLTEEQIDALQELVNIGVGRAANMLNEISMRWLKLLNGRWQRNYKSARWNSTGHRSICWNSAAIW